MKVLEVFRFEFTNQVRRAWTWLFVAALFVIAFFLTRDASLSEALRDDFFVNSPFAIAKVVVVGSLIWLLIAAATAGESAARDVATGMYPLMYTTAISKAEYLGGRFLAAFVLNAIILLSLPVGNLFAIYMPGVDEGAIGPFRFTAYLGAYAFIALPNAFFATAFQFALAIGAGRPMAAYGGSVLLFVMSYAVATFLLEQGRPDIANLLDPVGIHFILSDFSYQWTTVEKSTRLIRLEETVLWNRLLWLGLGSGALLITYIRFRFAHRGAGGGRFVHSKPTDSRSGEDARSSMPQFRQVFSIGIQMQQVAAITGISFWTIVRSWSGAALLVFVPALAVLVVIDQMVSEGVPLLPKTALVIHELTGPLAAQLSRSVIVPLFTIYFAGELIWRERDTGIGEITDATPLRAWVPFCAKFVGLALVIATFTALQMSAGILAQVLLGYREYEIDLYLQILLGLQLPEYLIFALLALVVHVLVNQKYIAHLVLVIVYLFMVLAPMFGVEHNLLIFGAGPAWSYTEMRGFGGSLGPWFWFKLYWAAWTLLIAVAGRLLWVRGREQRPGFRLRLARDRLAGSTVGIAGATMVFIFSVGGYIFYNTNVLNDYVASSDSVERRAEYERRYRQFAELPRPEIAEIDLNIEIYPEQRAARIHGSYLLVNMGTEPVQAIHVSTAPGLHTVIALDRMSSREITDEDHGYQSYSIDPLQPGDSQRLHFTLQIEPRGFGENGVDGRIVANGTAFTNLDWLPAMGYLRTRELTSARDRRAQRLEPRPLIPSLYDAGERINRDGGFLLDVVLSTTLDQVAVAPGALRRTWTEGGRRFFHYASDLPIGNEFAIFSARYAMHEEKWKDVDIRVYHHPGHTAQRERMLSSIRASLEYYTRHFGPYEHQHISFVERPGNGTGMHADASLISFSEGTALWTPEDDPGTLDLPFAVVAHEMAHQWTAPYAFVEGAPVMSESLAWYYGMQVVEATYGRDHLRRLLAFMRQPSPYPPIRRGEPLLRGLDPYLSYRKGPFALFALSEYIGRDQVNSALRRLLENHRAEGAALATTLDLYRELQAVTPAAFQYLLHDLFEVNTFWQLETNRVTAKQTNAGSWQVTIDVEAHKTVADIAGIETDVPMDELVEIGIFARSGAGMEDGDGMDAGDGELSEPLYVQKHRIRTGEQSITVTVPREPILAGVDPYHLLDWVEDGDDDNIARVVIE